jgi:HAMP domain-containing protein
VIAVGLVFYSLLLIIGTWVIARRTQTAPKAQIQIVNAQAEVIRKQVEAQQKVIEEINHDVSAFNLADYLNEHKPD